MLLSNIAVTQRYAQQMAPLLMGTRCSISSLTSRHRVEGKPKTKSSPHVARVRQRWCGQKPEDLEVSHLHEAHETVGDVKFRDTSPDGRHRLYNTQHWRSDWRASVIERGCQAGRIAMWQTLQPSLLVMLHAGSCMSPSGAGALLLKRNSG